MEKRKPTIDEIYKLNVDGLFESTANWFDNAFKKSQAEINRDLYNKINGYSSSSESTGGNVSLGPLLNSLNDSNLYPSKGYLYYNGNDWEFNTPTISGGEGGVVDTAAITKIVNDTIKNISWWGQNINNNKVDGNIVITKGSHSFTIELDDNGNLKFNGNIYATGGITALGVGSTPGSGSGVSLGTLLTKLNSDNPFPTDNGQVLTYDGSNFVWKIPTGSDDSSSSSRYPLTIYNGSSNTDYITYDGSSSTYLRFKSGFSISKVGLGYEISASGGDSGSSGTTSGKLYFGAQNKKLSFNGSTDMYLTFGDGLKVEKLYDQIIVSATVGGTGGSGVTLNPTMSAMNDQLGETTSNTPQFLYWDGSTYTWKNESEISGGSGSSGTTSGRLRFHKNSSEESWNGESDFNIIFGSGLNVTWDSNSQITLSATGGSSTGDSVDLSNYLTKTEASTTYAAKSHTHSAADITNFASTVKGITVNNAKNAESVSWLDVTNKPSTFTPSSHTHSTSDISGLSNYVQGVKVSNAANADKATKLANSRTIWGQSFNGTSDINGNLYMGSAGGGSIQLWMNNDNILERINNTLHIAYGLKESSNGEIDLDAYRTVIYTDNRSKHYDFKSNVFDVNSNQIHFGSETNGGKISWDTANNAFKIEGNVYATGGITALGVSNNATTSNNVDFTFNNVSARGGTFENLAAGDMTFKNGDISYSQHTLSLRNNIMLYSGNNDYLLSLGNTFTLRILSDLIKGFASQEGGALILNNVEKLIFGVTGQHYARYKFDINSAISAGILVSTTETFSDEEADDTTIVSS